MSRTASTPPRAGGVHIWTIRVGEGTADCGSLLPLLDEHERDRAQRFWPGPLRNKYVATHAAVRRILATYLGSTPEGIRFDRLPGGKPFVVGSPVAFNLSDSGAFALCAVAPSGHLGVDIEIRRRIEDADALVRRYFTIREIAEYLRADAPARLEAFFTLWTRKEALLKATGEGLRRPLDSVDAGNAIDLNAPVRLPDAAGVERCWSVRSFTPSPGYSGAVAYDGDLSGLEFFDWSDAAGETLLDRPRLVVGGDAWR